MDTAPSGGTAAGYFLRARKQGRTQTAYCIILIFGYLWALGQHLENSIYSLSAGGKYLPGGAVPSVTWACAFWGQPACISAGATAESTGSIVTRSGLPPCSVQARYFISLSLPTTCTIYTTPGSASPDGATACCSTPSPLLSYGCFVYAYLTMQRVKWDAEDRSTWLLLLCFGPPVAANTWGMFVRNPALDFTPPPTASWSSGPT